MCIAVPGKIITIEDTSGKVEVMGIEMMVALDFIESPKIGDYVLIHAGCAIEKIEEEEGKEIISIFRELDRR